MVLSFLNQHLRLVIIISGTYKSDSSIQFSC